MKTIEITVLPNGQSRVETKGFTGSECREASRFVAAALGQAMTEVRKPEFYQTASSSQQHRQDS